MGPIIKHMNWALTLVNALPESVSGRWVPGACSTSAKSRHMLTVIGWDGWLKLKNDILGQIRDIKATQGTKNWELNVNHPTIFHELLSSEMLPDVEKETERLAQDGQILVQGGTLTTSWALSLAVFHLCHRPETLQKLRDELFEAIPNVNEVVPIAQLESLPYLRAVVKETLRHSVGTSSRLSRIAPDESFDVADADTGKSYHIPAGTVVSMSPYRTIMDAGIFADPFGFYPERWLKEDERLDGYMIMFGGGTRVCLGQALAQAELHLMLAKLFRRWGSGGEVGGDETGDRREGDVGVFKIFETTPKDCQMASDYFIPMPYKVRGKSAVVRVGLMVSYRAARVCGFCWKHFDRRSRGCSENILIRTGNTYGSSHTRDRSVSSCEYSCCSQTGSSRFLIVRLLPVRCQQ